MESQCHRVVQRFYAELNAKAGGVAGSITSLMVVTICRSRFWPWPINGKSITLASITENGNYGDESESFEYKLAVRISKAALSKWPSASWMLADIAVTSAPAVSALSVTPGPICRWRCRHWRRRVWRSWSGHRRSDLNSHMRVKLQSHRWQLEKVSLYNKAETLRWQLWRCRTSSFIRKWAWSEWRNPHSITSSAIHQALLLQQKLTQVAGSFAAKAGDVVTFDYFFDGGDYLPFNDFAFIEITGEAQSSLQLLITIFSPITGHQIYQYVIQESDIIDGIINFAVGITDVGDTAVTSSLNIAGFQSHPSIPGRQEKYNHWWAYFQSLRYNSSFGSVTKSILRIHFRRTKGAVSQLEKVIWESTGVWLRYPRLDQWQKMPQKTTSLMVVSVPF